MYTAILAVGLIVQQTADPGGQAAFGNSLDRLSKAVESDQHRQLFDKSKDFQARFQEREFIQRFNDLVTAMGKFSQKYRSEHVIDIKKVESIKKAYRNLEKSDPWFKAVQ